LGSGLGSAVGCLGLGSGSVHTLAARSTSRKRWLHCSAARSDGAERCEPTSTSMSSGNRSSTRQTPSAGPRAFGRRRGSETTTLHTPAWSRPFCIFSVHPSRQQQVMPLPPMALSREDGAMELGRAGVAHVRWMTLCMPMHTLHDHECACACACARSTISFYYMPFYYTKTSVRQPECLPTRAWAYRKSTDGFTCLHTLTELL
jgi:hypothetical protein